MTYPVERFYLEVSIISQLYSPKTDCAYLGTRDKVRRFSPVPVSQIKATKNSL